MYIYIYMYTHVHEKKEKKRKSEGKGLLMGVVEVIIGSEDHEIQRGATTLRNSPSLRDSHRSLSLKLMRLSPNFYSSFPFYSTPCLLLCFYFIFLTFLPSLIPVSNLGEISRYFLPVQPAHRIQNLCNFFKKKHKMLFGNLIMICRQRLWFSAWLKNRGFRVREI